MFLTQVRVSPPSTAGANLATKQSPSPWLISRTAGPRFGLKLFSSTAAGAPPRGAQACPHSPTTRTLPAESSAMPSPLSLRSLPRLPAQVVSPLAFSFHKKASAEPDKLVSDFVPKATVPV